MFPIDQNLKYEDVCDPSWEQAVGELGWKETGEKRWTLTGNCPHCKHQIKITYKEGIFVGILSKGKGAVNILLKRETKPIVKAKSGKVSVFCNCAEAHPPKAAGSGAGCGRFGKVPGPPITGNR